MKRAITAVSTIACTLLLLTGVSPAQASFPGRPGKIAYSTGAGPDITVARRDGTSRHKITSIGSAEAPQFSPDGSWIVFDEYDLGSLYKIRADGTKKRKIPTTKDSGDSPWSPSWHPNGRKIVYAAEGGSSEIWRVDSDGSHNVLITALTGEWPRYSPDGSKIAFNHESEIWIMNANGSDPQNLGGGGTVNRYPDWSPNGQWIAYLRDGEIWKMRANGSNETLVSAVSADWGPTWSPKGNQLAFPTNGQEVGFVAPDGTGFHSEDFDSTACCIAWQPRPRR